MECRWNHGRLEAGRVTQLACWMCEPARTTSAAKDSPVEWLEVPPYSGSATAKELLMKNTRTHAPDFRPMVSRPIRDHFHVDACRSHPTDLVTLQTVSD